MNKKEYLSKLRMYLHELPINELEDILSDYEEHFNIGISKGKSEEEISKELGDPKEVALSYKNTLDIKDEVNNYKRKSPNNWIPIIVGTVLILFVISFLGNTINIRSKGEKVKIGTNGIEVRDGTDHVIIGWNGIKVKDGKDEVSIGWDGIKINNTKSNWNIFGSNSKDLKWEKVNEERFANINDIEIISISSPFVDVKITTEDRDNVRIYYYGEMKTTVVPKLNLEEGNRNLDIKLQLPKNINSYSVNESNVVLEIFIPKNYNGNINCASSSGDIYIKDIVGKAFNITTSSGDLYLENIDSEIISITTSSGDMELDDIVGKLNISSSSGDIFLEDITSENIKISTSSGDIIFNLDDDANYEIKGSTSSGDFIPNSKMKIKENQRGSFKATIGSGDNYLEINTSSGDVIFK